MSDHFSSLACSGGSDLRPTSNLSCVRYGRSILFRYLNLLLRSLLVQGTPAQMTELSRPQVVAASNAVQLVVCHRLLANSYYESRSLYWRLWHRSSSSYPKCNWGVHVCASLPPPSALILPSPSCSIMGPESFGIFSSKFTRCPSSNSIHFLWVRYRERSTLQVPHDTSSSRKFP